VVIRSRHVVHDINHLFRFLHSIISSAAWYAE
jgi:hypothetical protein